MLNRSNLAAALALMVGPASAWADVAVVLTLDRPQPVAAGDTVGVAVAAQQEPGSSDLFLRLAGLDFSASDPELSLNSFAFEPPLLVGSAYALYPALPLPQMVYPGVGQDAQEMLTIPGDGSLLHLGTIHITLPAVQGIYVLDAVHHNPLSPLGNGALFSHGFGVMVGDPITDFVVGNGVAGGQLSIQVVPEPATVLLIVAGMLAGCAVRLKP